MGRLYVGGRSHLIAELVLQGLGSIGLRDIIYRYRDSSNSKENGALMEAGFRVIQFVRFTLRQGDSVSCRYMVTESEEYRLFLTHYVLLTCLILETL